MAKAMLVVQSRPDILSYKKEFDAQINAIAMEKGELVGTERRGKLINYLFL
jgi:hypothetical protein